MADPSHAAGAPRPAVGSSRRSPDRGGRRRAGSGEPALAALTWALAERRWTILSVLLFALAGAAAFLFIAPPVYQGTVLLQLAGAPLLPGRDHVSGLDPRSPAEAELRLLRSRTLVGAAVEQLRLDIEAGPRRFPIVGAAVARLRGARDPAPTPPGLGRFGWGGERIVLQRLEVSPALAGEPLVLEAFEDGAYEVRDGDGGVLVTGMVGLPATGANGDRTVSVLVSELAARPGTEFALWKRRAGEVEDDLLARLEVTGHGGPAGLAELRLIGTDPALVASILETLATTYVRESLARTSAELETLLRRVEARLPGLSAEVEAADRALTRFHRRNGKVNLSVDAQRLLLRINELERAVADAEHAQAELARRHTARYPELAPPADRARRLRAERDAVEARIGALPALELEHARLARRVAVATERHDRVLSRAEELRTAMDGWPGRARVLEHAVEPRRPVSARPRPVLALAALLGVVGGVAAALVRSALDGAVRDPGELETSTGLPVFAAVPRSAAQLGLGRRRRGGRLSALSVIDPGDAAVEELRALRAGVAVALARASNHVVAIGSPAPGTGKSFVTVNLAQLLAAPDGRVLVVDADLRRGLLHRYFGLDAQPGLSDVLSGAATVEAAIRKTESPHVDLLSSGQRVTNPAELLSGDGLRELLEAVGGRYGAVVIDTPPVLSVIDGALVGRHAAVNLLVVRSGEQTPRDVVLAVKRLARSGIKVGGAVLNDVRPTLHRYGRSGRYRYYDTHPA